MDKPLGLGPRHHGSSSLPVPTGDRPFERLASPAPFCYGVCPGPRPGHHTGMDKLVKSPASEAGVLGVRSLLPVPGL